MNKKFKEIGVAVVTNENSRYKIYWTQNFGRDQGIIRDIWHR